MASPESLSLLFSVSFTPAAAVEWSFPISTLMDVWIFFAVTGKYSRVCRFESSTLLSQGSAIFAALMLFRCPVSCYFFLFSLFELRVLPFLYIFISIVLFWDLFWICFLLKIFTSLLMTFFLSYS